MFVKQKNKFSIFKKLQAMSYIPTDGVEYSDYKKTLIKSPKEAIEITILEGVASIGEFAFYNTGLSSIFIPNCVTSIKDGVFFRLYKGTFIRFNNIKYH